MYASVYAWQHTLIRRPTGRLCVSSKKDTIIFPNCKTVDEEIALSYKFIEPGAISEHITPTVDESF